MPDTSQFHSGTEQVFLSYSHTDRDAAVYMRNELEKAGFSVFRDEDSIRMGSDWMDRLQTALEGCSVFVVLIGQDGVQRWVGVEVQVALTRHISPHDDTQRLPIFPIVLPGGDVDSLPPFLSTIQIQSWAADKALPAAMVSAIRDKRQLLNDAVMKWDPDKSPFLGLGAFQPQHAHLFFGRRQETLDALKYLGAQQPAHPENIHRADSSFCRWLQIEGNSGSGKSSLVNAGMLPLIREGALWSRTGFSGCRIIGPMMPGKKPLDRLALALDHALISDQEKRDHLGRLARLESGDQRILASMLKDAAQQDSAFLLVVDQFEELFTFSAKVEKDQFDAQLAYALQDMDCPLFLITTVRIDFLEGFEQLLCLSGLYNEACKRYLLKTISREGLREVIEQPARLAGLDVSEITTAMLRDAQDEIGALPLAENALHYLWEQRQGNRLSGALYHEKGGIAGLLEDQADALLKQLDKEIPGGGKSGALELLLALTHINPGGRHTRQRISLEEARLVAGQGNWDELEQGQKVIDYLSGMPPPDGSNRQFKGSLRLITSGGESNGENLNKKAKVRGSWTGKAVTPEPDYQEQFVDLIHETLIRARGKDQNTGKLVGYWKTLYQYIENNRGRPFHRDQLKLKAEDWQACTGLMCWWKLAGWSELKFYRKLRPSERSPESRFLFWSRSLAWAELALLTLVLAFVGESFWWTLIKHEFPPSYMLMQQRFRLVSAEWLAEPLPEMVEIKAGGEFQMGELDLDFVQQRVPPKYHSNFGIPATQSVITKPFYLSRYEITFEQYDYYIWVRQHESKNDESVDYPSSGRGGRGQRPVVNVTWNDANGYLRWLSDKTKKKYSLPTEAEWEYAARAGTETAYWWGNEPGKNKANCEDCGSIGEKKELSPVGSFEANAFGLYDTVGNVWEWTCSAWREQFDGSENDCVDANDKQVSRVIRGGSWGNHADILRSSARFSIPPELGNSGVGFRAARTN